MQLMREFQRRKIFSISNKSEKLTVPIEPKLSTNQRASRRQSLKKDESLCDSDSSKLYSGKSKPLMQYCF